MKLRKLRPDVLFIVVPSTVAANGNAGNNEVSYVIGAVIAVFLLAYLVCSLLKPDKF